MLSDTPMRLHHNFRSVPRGTTAAPASWSCKDGVEATMPPGNAQTHRRVSKLIPFGVGSLRRALDNYLSHYLQERNHRGRSNTLLFAQKTKLRPGAAIECHERLGGLLRDSHRKAASVLRCSGVGWSCWRVACRHQFSSFLLVSLVRSRDRGSKDTVVFLRKSAPRGFLTIRAESGLGALKPATNRV